jgi:hypothetical protein
MKALLKRFALSAHKLLLRIGLMVLPNHYYVTVPDLNELARTRAVWAKKSELPGLHFDSDEQLEILRDICEPYIQEYGSGPDYRHAVEHHFGPGYGPIEAEVLYAFLRRFQPPRIVEIGSGVSTYCMLQAIDHNIRSGGVKTRLTCIEPYPSNFLRSADVELIEQNVQEIDIRVFETLRAGDFVFIDSSHTVKTGGDCNFLYLEVIPRLSCQIFIQVHDIFLPFDYRPDSLETLLHWPETSLLRALLINNTHLEVLFCLSFLHHQAKDGLIKLFPNYDPREYIDGLQAPATNPMLDERHFPSSIYLRTH